MKGIEQNPNFAEFLKQFRTLIETQHQTLIKLPENIVSVPPTPGKWSIKEIIGHLVDSASNNHQRFLRAVTQGNLIFLPYEQEKWVQIQQYAAYPWPQLADFWRLYNLHLLGAMQSIAEEVRTKETTDHNFDQIAWTTVPKGEKSSLEYFMRDYVGHLIHHLEQVKKLVY